METPDTIAGRLTEKIMAKVRENLPLCATSDYNRIYESALEVLTTHLFDSDEDDQPMTQAEFDAMWEKMTPEARAEYNRMRANIARRIGKRNPFLDMLEAGVIPKGLGNAVRTVINERAKI